MLVFYCGSPRHTAQHTNTLQAGPSMAYPRVGPVPVGERTERQVFFSGALWKSVDHWNSIGCTAA